MLRLFRWFLTILSLLTLLALVGGVVRTLMMVRTDDQDLFLASTTPAPLPDGFYVGDAGELSGPWLGKRFDRANSRGINLFSQRGQEREAYPFRTSIGKGLRDGHMDVLQIDYDIDGNPFWLRPALDEMVQVQPGLLLGKLHYRLIPGYPFTITFFRLEMQ